jgi:hypothetical protein
LRGPGFSTGFTENNAIAGASVRRGLKVPDGAAPVCRSKTACGSAISRQRIETVGAKLTALCRGTIRRVIINKPPERQAASEFETTAQGCRLATSVGGMLTGRGADLIIIDDPLKPEEALRTEPLVR